MTMLSLRNENISETINVGAKCQTILEKYDCQGNEVSKDFKNFKDAMAATLKGNLEMIDQLPPIRNLSKSQIKEHMTKIVQKDMEKSDLLEKSVEIRKYTSDIARYLTNYFKEIFNHNMMLRKRLESELFELWRMYYNSDLPLSYISTMEKANLLNLDFLDIYEKVLHREHVDLRINRNNGKKFENLCKAHNKWIEQFNNIDELIKLRFKLFWYIDFCNCDTVEEILKVKKVKTAYLDLKEMDNLSQEIGQLVNEVVPLLEKYTHFQGIPSYNDEGVRALSKFVEAMCSSEG